VESIKYLLSLLAEKTEVWEVHLKEILMSNSVQASDSYNENINLLLLKFKRRIKINQEYTNEIVGGSHFIERIPLCSDNQVAKVYSLKNNIFSGECIIVNNEIIGCAFIKRGALLLKKAFGLTEGKLISKVTY